MHHFRRYIIAGLLVWLPIWVTLLVIRFLVELLDGTMSLLPRAYQPDSLIGFHIPGLGVLISILIVFFTGMLVTNFLGRKIIELGEALVARIPLVRTIYMATKQVLETLFSSSSESFRQVALIEYPRKGLWSIAFQTGNCAQEIASKAGHDMITVFVPTTPNPTSGFLMMVPKEDVIALDMTVDQALKLVISLGVVQPNNGEAVVMTNKMTATNK